MSQSNAAKATCSSLPAFTFGKLVEKTDVDGKVRLHVVLNIKASYTGKIDVALWQGYGAVPPAALCKDKDGKEADLLKANECTGATSLSPYAVNGKTANPSEEFEASSDGKDNQVVFPEGLQLKDVFRHPKVLIYYTTETDKDNQGCSKVTGSALASLADLHSFEINAGDVLVMQKASSSSSSSTSASGVNFKSQFEAAYSQADIWGRDVMSYTDIRYSYLGAVASTNNAGSNSQPSAAPVKAGSGAAMMSSVPNPFQSGGGTLRTNIYFSLFGPQFKERAATISPIAGAGFTTVPDNTSVHAPLRGFAGFRFDIPDLNTASDAAHFGGSSGYLQVGYAYDNFWAYDKTPSSVTGMPGTPGQRHRIFIEGQVKLPNSTLSAAPRIFIDLPASGGGNTDLRISLLAVIDATQLGTWISGAAGGGK